MNYQLKETLISVEGLNVKYGDKVALHDVNFKVPNVVLPDTGKPKGQIIAFIGPSGSGKSTLFKAISGFLELTAENGCSGTVKIGSDLHQVQMGEVGVIPQNYPLLNHRTIYENFHIALKGNNDKDNVINEYSNYFDLFELLSHYPEEVSGGQRQRAAILQQILAGNQIILADEPYSGLDFVVKDKVTDLLIKAADITEENTIIIVSHDIESACAIADHVFVLGSDGTNEGSTILKVYDFLAEDLAYHADIREIPRFREIIKEIKDIMIKSLEHVSRHEEAKKPAPAESPGKISILKWAINKIKGFFISSKQ